MQKRIKDFFNKKLANYFLQKVMFFKKKPFLAVTLLGMVLVFYLNSMGSKTENTPAKNNGDPIEFEEEKGKITGIKDSVDPRDVWVEKVSQVVEQQGKQFEEKIGQLENQLDDKMSQLQQTTQELQLLQKEQKQEFERKALEDSLSKSNPTHSSSIYQDDRKQKTVGIISKKYSSHKKNVKEYITSGTFARGVLMTGLVVGTGTNTVSNPEPVMIRLVDVGIFSKGMKTQQIKEAVLIGDCSGDLSSERAKCRLQTLSLKNYRGEIIERNVKGWVVGEDGRFGIKGIVVDKSSDLLRLAMLNGVLGGMSQFLQNQSTKSIFPISPIAGQKNAMSAKDQFKGGAASGAGDAFSKMADFIMDRFNSMSPQIAISSGREVDIIFQEGVDLNGEGDSIISNVPGANKKNSQLTYQNNSKDFQNLTNKVEQEMQSNGNSHGM